MISSKIRILLVDDHVIVRHGYRTLLEKLPDIEIAAEAADATEAYACFQDVRPDVLIMDISMPGPSGIEAIGTSGGAIRMRAYWSLRCIRNPAFAIQATRAGALGYITKSSAPDILIRAVYEVYGGRRVLSPDIAQALAISKLQDERIPLGELSPREFEILQLLVGGRTPQEIAQSLHLSPKTVANGHYEIKRKLGVKSDIELVRLALRLHVIDLVIDDVNL
ncbi:MAG: response regulator [Gammaproteobacteria bacterium]